MPYVEHLCGQLYARHVTDEGSNKPSSFAEIAALITQSGANLCLLSDAPLDLLGVQIGDTVYINASPLIPEWRRIRIGAHEWCHWLRRDEDARPAVQLYDGESSGPNAGEERIAKEFELLFDIR